ncbi:MAG: HAMP domain-containing protein [Desulfobulbaceae bacterium]|nr:HAMP domain-containing protein [Desulfobulbaceae bacterium]
MGSLVQKIFARLKSEHEFTFSRKFSIIIPIWLQVSIAIIMVILVTIVTISMIFLKRQEQQLHFYSGKMGLASLNYFSSNARIPLLENNVLMLNNLIKDALDNESMVYALIVDRNQIIKAHTDHQKIDSELARFEDVTNINKTGKAVYFTHITPDGKKILNITTPITFNRIELGAAHVGVSLDIVEETIKNDRKVILFTTGYILFFAIIIAVLLGVRFSRPISELVKATEEISRGNYSHKLAISRRDEIGNLAFSFNRMSDELFKKSLMQETFGKYVGPEVVKMIMDNPGNPWLKGKRNQATILFTDIRGFTQFSEEKEPEEVVNLLNLYFETATRIITAHGGYIDKFIGDAVLAVFGVPVFHENHVERAVRSAVAMQEEFKKMSLQQNDFFGKIGIGINSGLVVSGNIGSQSKMEYTIIGDSVNTASRLNGLAGSGEIIISKNIMLQVENEFEMYSLPKQKVKGKAEAIEVFKLTGLK